MRVMTRTYRNLMILEFEKFNEMGSMSIVLWMLPVLLMLHFLGCVFCFVFYLVQVCTFG